MDDLSAGRTWLHRTTGSPRYAPRGRCGPDRLHAVAFVNFKGGAGKTTSASPFAQWLVLQGYRAQLVDLDPQAGATALLGLAPTVDVAEGDTLAAWMRREADEEEETALPKRSVRRTRWPGLDLLPASIALPRAEHDPVGDTVGGTDAAFSSGTRRIQLDTPNALRTFEAVPVSAAPERRRPSSTRR